MALVDDTENAQLTRCTLQHYESHAEAFWQGTSDHDVSRNVNTLLARLAVDGPASILDLGCGPGRDLIEFRRRGHTAIGLDGCEAFARHARAASSCEVWCRNFLDMALPLENFDGVFANASLFHVPSGEISRVLRELHGCLRPAGVLLSSNPRGDDEEGLNGERYGAYYREETWRRLAGAAGFEEIESYYRPEGLPRERQPWWVSAWRKC